MRSLLPADLSKLFFLGGFACLFIAPSLGWWPEPLSKLIDIANTPPEEYRKWYRIFAGELLILTLPIRIAGAASLFAYFFPSQKLFRRFLYWIYLPVLISLLAVSARLLVELWCPPSVLESSVKYALGGLKNAPQIFLRLGPGFHYTLAGVLFVALGAWRARRLATTPADSFDSGVKFILQGPTEEQFEKQTSRFAWIVIVAPLLAWVGSIGFTYAYTAIANAISFWPDWVLGMYRLFGQGLFSLIFVVIAALAIGKRKYEVLKSSLRLPTPINLALAVLMPIAVACSCPFFSYMDDRIHWASFGYGRYSQPLLESYFNFPGLLALFAIIPALAEEIAWRGYVQPRFIQLHGLARGIFFTGIVWGAFHFTFDFGPRLSEADVLVAVLRRLTMAIAISVALAWITIRSGSVWPAAIFHGLYNILLGVAKQPALPLAPWSAYAIWMLLGLVLFRFWPPKTQIVSDLAPGVDTLQEPDQVD